MTGPGKNQPARTAAAADLETDQKPTRKRCEYCGSFFKLPEKPKGGSPPRFCPNRGKCRKAFHREGAGFGKLRDRLPKMIEDAVKRQLALTIEDRSEIYRKEITALFAEFHFVDRTEITDEAIELLKRAVRRRREKVRLAADTKEGNGKLCACGHTKVLHHPDLGYCSLCALDPAAPVPACRGFRPVSVGAGSV